MQYTYAKIGAKVKKLISIILTITIISVSVLFVSCSDILNTFKSGSNNGLEGSILDWAIIPEEGETEETIALAVRMFDNANELYKQVKYCRYSTYGSIKAGANCERYIFNVKNENEWYSSEVQHVENPLVAIFSPSFLTLKYGNLDYGKAVVLNATKDISVSKETGVPYGDLSSATASEEDLPIFNVAQNGKHIQTDFVITEETVKSATITHNDEEGYFTVTIELDVQNEEAIAKPWADLKESSKDAKYTSCTEIIEIWDSGHYKYFNAIDKWTGTAVVKINAVIDYKTYFTYDKSDCNLNDYFGYETLLSMTKLKEE